MTHSEKTQKDAIRFCRELGPALLTYGAPAHRIEDVMLVITKVYGIEGQIFSVPTAFISSFNIGQKKSPAHLQRIKANEINLTKLADLDKLFNEVAQGIKSPQEGLKELPHILSAPPPYNRIITLISFGMASGGATLFFGGGLPEIYLAIITGLGLGCLSIIGSHNRQISRLFEPLGAFLVAFLATICSIFWENVSVDKSTLGGLIVLIPGFTLTLAIAELATRNLVSGTSRLAASTLSFFMLVFGTALGRRMGEYLIGNVTLQEVNKLPIWSLVIGLPIASTTIGILFKVPKKDLAWVFAISLSGYLGIKVGSQIFGTMLGVFFGAIAVGSGSNIYARLTNKPASITRLPGLLFLLPGSLGFLSLSTLINGDAIKGINDGFQVMMVAISLVTGLLVSSAIISPRKAL